MNNVNRWSFTGLAKSACQAGVNLAQKAVSCTLGRVYSVITRNVQDIQQKTLDACQGTGVVAKAAKVAVTTTRVLSEYGKHILNKERITLYGFAGMMAASAHYAAIDIPTESSVGIFLIYALAIKPALEKIKPVQPNLANRVIRVVEQGTELAMIPLVLTFAGAGIQFLYNNYKVPLYTILSVGCGELSGFVRTPNIPAIEGSRSRTIEMGLGHIVGIGISCAGTQIMGRQLLQSPLLTTTAAVGLAILLFKVGKEYPFKDYNPLDKEGGQTEIYNTVKSLSTAASVTIAHALLADTNTKTASFVCYQLSGFCVGALYPNLEYAFWKRIYKSAQRKLIIRDTFKRNTKAIFPREIQTIINEYLFRSPKAAKPTESLTYFKNMFAN